MSQVLFTNVRVDHTMNAITENALDTLLKEDTSHLCQIKEFYQINTKLSPINYLQIFAYFEDFSV